MTQPEAPKRKLRVLIADDVQETRRNTRLMLATIDDVEVVAIASPTLFIWVLRVGSACGNFSKAKRGTLVTT